MSFTYIADGKGKLTRSMSLSCRYTDSLISLNNNKFKEFTTDILQINKTNDPILNLTPENITQHSRIE